jgi:hypothetical protein
MKRTSPWWVVIASVAMTSGCVSDSRVRKGNPSVRGITEVSVKIIDESDHGVAGGRATRSTAKLGDNVGQGVMTALGDCRDDGQVMASLILAPFCALVGAVVGTVVANGAAADGVQKYPTAASLDRLHKPEQWLNQLQASLERQGRERGKQVLPFPRGTTINLVIKQLFWNPTRDGTVAISGRFWVVVGAEGRFKRHEFIRSSPDFTPDQWLGDGGKRVAMELQRLFEGVASHSWEVADG